jgi:NitT/TauT family transport system permease protein/taurine transport system permease protein
MSAVSGGLFIVLWWVATGPSRLVDTTLFPDPKAFYESLHQITFAQYAGGDLAKHVLTSTWLVARGFALAVVVGIGLGMLMSWSAFWRDLLLPMFNFVRPVPPLAWIPLALLWFGLGDTSKLFVITLAASVPLVISTRVGVAEIDRTLLAAAAVHGARGWNLLRHVVLPGAMPHITIGLRLALQTSWTVIVAAELLGSIWGVGRVLTAAKDDVYPGMILVGMLTVGALGMLSSVLLTRLEKTMLPWRH